MITEVLVESIPPKGIRVRVIKGEEIAELMDIRLMIEAYYIQRIIQSFNEGLMKEKLLQNLREQIRIIEHVANIEDYFKYYNLDFEFHQMYLSGCKNKKILQIYNSLGTHGYAFYVYRMATVKKWLKELEDKHGIKVVSFNWVQGMRHMVTNKTIRKPEDLKGLRIRTPGPPIWQESIRSLGVARLLSLLGILYRNATKSDRWC